MNDIIDQIGRLRVLPVVVIKDVAHARPLAQALRTGGLAGAEVTLRTSEGLSALRIMAQEPHFLLGAGTVTRESQVSEALAAGARFVVTPGFSLAVVRECQILQVPVIPGVATATEIQMAVDAGLTTVKFFPAVVAGGVPAIKALSAPYTQIRFVPTGGIGPVNVRQFLDLPQVLAVGGSWMVTGELIGEGDFAQISALTAEAVALCAGASS